MEHGKVFVEDVTVRDRMRSIDDTKVTALAESMKAIGLQHPISVWAPTDQEVVLVAGAHRLEAARRLGWESIPCVFVNMDENARRRWEIAENLHRADLTALQTDEHRAEWIRLTDAAAKGAQLAPPGGRQPHARGIKAAVKEFGIERTAAQRAVKIAELTPAAKAAARETGLDDNRSAMLTAAKAAPDLQEQVIRNIAEQKRSVSTGIARRSFDDVDEQQLKAMQNAWNRASQRAREAFRTWLDEQETPVFDRGAA